VAITVLIPSFNKHMYTAF